ncbi:unnamed protein product [Lactuca virosa]|uniref:Uncharacterized protein n=1 Tax=Lactuca virosa TaxID=75947 RepID=A0AAU9P3D5_9ASTR|nr:unnamed protein product [Lactuca virosa]
MVMEMNLGENSGVKQSVNGGGGRRKTKGSELTQKKNKQPQRGMGVEQLERLRLQERWKKMTEVPSLHHPFALPGFSSSSCTTVPNQNTGVQFRPAQGAAPAMLFHGIGIHGTNLFSTAEHVMDPSVNVGFRFDNSKELSSIPNYVVKCASDGCGVCHKKKRIHGGSNACSLNPFRNLAGNNSVVEMIDAAKTRLCSGQVTEVISVYRNGGSAMTEYEFFPEKGGRGTTSKTCCGSGSGSGGSVGGGAVALHGGDRSCVTAAITGNEEGSISSVDLSLKL